MLQKYMDLICLKKIPNKAKFVLTEITYKIKVTHFNVKKLSWNSIILEGKLSH